MNNGINYLSLNWWTPDFSHQQYGYGISTCFFQFLLFFSSDSADSTPGVAKLGGLESRWCMVCSCWGDFIYGRWTKNRVFYPPNHPCLIGFSLFFTIHFGVPLFLETPIYEQWTKIKPSLLFRGWNPPQYIIIPRGSLGFMIFISST